MRLRVEAAKYESAAQTWAMGWSMKAFVVIILVFLAAVSALAYGRIEMAAGVASAVAHTSPADESVWLFLSGSALIGLAGALRRSTF